MTLVLLRCRLDGFGRVAMRAILEVSVISCEVAVATGMVLNSMEAWRVSAISQCPNHSDECDQGRCRVLAIFVSEFSYGFAELDDCVFGDTRACKQYC